MFFIYLFHEQSGRVTNTHTRNSSSWLFWMLSLTFRKKNEERRFPCVCGWVENFFVCLLLGRRGCLRAREAFLWLLMYRNRKSIYKFMLRKPELGVFFLRQMISSHAEEIKNKRDAHFSFYVLFMGEFPSNPKSRHWRILNDKVQSHCLK